MSIGRIEYGDESMSEGESVGRREYRAERGLEAMVSGGENMRRTDFREERGKHIGRRNYWQERVFLFLMSPDRSSCALQLYLV